jgi:hypothetical protein
MVHEAASDAAVRPGLGETLAERLAAMNAAIARFTSVVDPGAMPTPPGPTPPAGSPPAAPPAGA